MPNEVAEPRTRRAILAGALGGLAALAAQAIGRPTPAVAADGGSLILGQSNSCDSATSITCLNGGFGVLAVNSGSGVWGATNDSAGAGLYGVGYPMTTGVWAANTSTAGVALKVEGKAHFNRSGRATVKSGKASVDITVPGGMSGSPLIFANLLAYRAGVHVAAVRPKYPSAGKARIYLNKAVPAATTVAWFVTD